MEISPTAIGTIIGAGLTVLGVIISTFLQNYFQNKRQKEQLTHESNLRKIEREMNMRRDIFLEGAEALGKIEEFILSFAIYNLDEKARGEIIKGVIQSINKMYLIAADETLKKMNDLQEFYLKRVQKLIQFQIDFNSTMIQIQNLTQSIDDLLSQHKQIKEMINNTDISGDNSQIENELVILKSVSDKINNLTIDRSKLDSASVAKYQKIYNASMEIHTKFQYFAAQVNIFARREIDLPLANEDDYAASIQRINSSHSLRATEDLKKSIENLQASNK